jgi:putative ABC transport system permease protein
MLFHPFWHYLWLGARSLRRNPVLAALAVLILAVGIAASMTSLTVLALLSADPIPGQPGQSGRLYVPRFDTLPPSETRAAPGADLQMGWLDAQQLLRDGQGTRRTVLYGVTMTLSPQRQGLERSLERGMAATADFFGMFDAPFAAGGAWSAVDDERRADVVVLSAPFARRLFGSEVPVQALIGRSVLLDDRAFRVIGVLADWQPVPRVYRILGSGVLGPVEDYFLPLRSAIALELPNQGWVNCTGTVQPGWDGFLQSECNWLQYWVELAPQDVAGYRDYLAQHVAGQRQLGRMQRSATVELTPMEQWLAERGVVGNDQRLQAALSLAFFVACLVNVMGLLAARYAARAGEVGVRRALGATRRQVFLQFLVESSVIGAAGGVLGLLLSLGGLSLLGRRSEGLATVAQMNGPLLAATVALAMAGALLAALWPTWRAAGVRPALQLKSQ